MASFRTLSRRQLVWAGFGLAMGSQPAIAAVRVVRGSRSGEAEAEASNIKGRGRVVRPGQRWSRSRSGQIGDMLAAQPTRKILLEHAHTAERLDLTYWRDGQFVQSAKPAIGWFLRDWRQSRPSPLSVSLLDIIWAVQKHLTGQGDVPPFRVLSAYRTRQTNEALLSAGVAGVARDSFHLRGMATDIHCPDRSYQQLEAACLALGPGGVGLYRKSGFIHLDSGPTRRWVG